MILKKTPLSIVEAKEYAKENPEIVKFIDKFAKIKIKEAKELADKIKKMDLMKVKEEHIVKIIDLLPETPEDLNKIFNDVSLDEDEIKKILDAIKEYK